VLKRALADQVNAALENLFQFQLHLNVIEQAPIGIRRKGDENIPSTVTDFHFPVVYVISCPTDSIAE
jgi:hypothetical protein